MNRKVLLIPLALLLAIGLVAIGCPAPAPPPAPAPAPAPPPAKPIELIMTQYATEKEATSVLFAEFEKLVTERTKGQVSFKKHYAGALGGAKEIVPLTSEGTADIGIFYPGYYPGLFNLSDVTKVPYSGLRWDAKQKAYMQMLKEFPEIEAEFTALNLKPLMPTNSAEVVLASKEKRIETLGDLRGLKFRSAGYDALTLEAWGATPVGIVYGEIYESMARGVIDGSFGMPISSYTPIGLHEITKYFIQSGIGALSGLHIVMNIDSYNKLPPDIQKIFVDTGVEALGDIYTNLRQDLMRNSIRLTVEAGVTEIYALSPDLQAQLKALAKDKVESKWIEDMVKAGISEDFARRFLARWHELYKKYEPESKILLFDEMYAKEFKK